MPWCSDDMPRKRFSKKVLLLAVLITIGLVFYKLWSDVKPPGPSLVKSLPMGDLRFIKDTPRASSDDSRGDSSTTSVNRTHLYCNSPFEAVEGAEGQGPDGFMLRMVHVFIRHGDRTPIYHLPGYKQTPFQCNFRKWYPEHGDVKAFKRFPTHMDNLPDPEKVFGKPRILYPQEDACAEQSLTNRGALQHLKLGQFLNERYIEKHNLLSNRKLLKEQFHVRITRTNRTFQSAIAFMYGFLPVFDTSNLSLSWSGDLFMCFAREKPCKCRYAEKLYGLFHKITKLNQSMGNSSHTAESLAAMLNIEAEHVRSTGLGHLMDVFLPSFCHRKDPLCSNVPPYTCIDEAKIDVMWTQYVNTEISRTADPERNAMKYSYLQLYPVLKEITRRIQKFKQGDIARKFTLFSGHDTTVTALLVVLGIYDGMWPPLASRVVIELYDSTAQANKDNLYLRFLYNGNDVTNDVAFCKGKLHVSLCEFDRFTEYLSMTMLELFGKTNFRDICDMKQR